MPKEYRYKELSDPEWLKDKYVDKHLPIKKICDLLGCTRSPVHHALKKHNLFERKITKYWQLKDKNWLYDQYIKRKNSN